MAADIATQPEDLLADLEAAVRHLASFPRPSASPGEARAAEWIAARLRAEGCAVSVEREVAHGTYWWPLGLLCALAGAGGLTGRRWPALAAGAFAAAGIADDITGGRQWFRRRFLPRRSAHNVVAEGGDGGADRTVVLVAHHDAAHWSLLFTPRFGELLGRRLPWLLERTNTSPPVMLPVIGGPVLVALGAALGRAGLRAVGAALSLGAAATFVEIGSRSTVPGAIDNLTGVATLIGVARALRERPVHGVRVLLVSTGAEESGMEGMQAFARRHFSALPPQRTHVICVDTVGSPELVLVEGEGMLRMRDYPVAVKELISRCAVQAGVQLRRGLRFRNATDGLIPLKAGYPAAMLGSVNRYKVPANYHWPTDVPDNVDFQTVRAAVALCENVVRTLAQVPHANLHTQK